MKSLRTTIVIFLAGIAVGYGTKTLMQKTEAPPGRDETANELTSTAQTEPNPARTTIQFSNSTSTTFTKANQNSTAKTGTDPVLTEAGSTELQPLHSNDDFPDFPDSINGVPDDWVASHKTRVFDTIKQIAPEQIANGLQEMVAKDSQFLQNRGKKLGLDEDERWSYNTENMLRSLITSHPLSADFEVASVTCKQLMCEVIGVVYNSDSWHSIYRHVLTSAPNIIPPWEAGEELLVVHFKDDGLNYSYNLYEFSQ